MDLITGLAVGFGIMILTAVGMLAWAIYLRNRDVRERQARQAPTPTQG